MKKKLFREKQIRSALIPLEVSLPLFPSICQHRGNNWALSSLPALSASVTSIRFSFLGLIWQHREAPKTFPFKNKVPQGLIYIQEQIWGGTFIHQLAKGRMIWLFKQFLGNEQGGECSISSIHEPIKWLCWSVLIGSGHRHEEQISPLPKNYGQIDLIFTQQNFFQKALFFSEKPLFKVMCLSCLASIPSTLRCLCSHQPPLFFT